MSPSPQSVLKKIIQFVDDDDMETVIYLRHAKSQLPLPPSPNEPIVIDSPTSLVGSSGSSEIPHGLNVRGQQASCLENDAILVDCVGCLTGQAEKTLGALSDPERGVAKRVLDILHDASGEGITKDVLFVNYS